MKATRITGYYSIIHGTMEGWVFYVWGDDGIITHSEEVWCPVDADAFRANHREELTAALAAQWPAAEIELSHEIQTW
jgi:hypothetical protein